MENKYLRVSELADIATYQAHKEALPESGFQMSIGLLSPKVYTERKDAGQALMDMIKSVPISENRVTIGSIAGMDICVYRNVGTLSSNTIMLCVQGILSHPVEAGSDPNGNITRLLNMLDNMPARLQEEEKQLDNLYTQLESAREELQRPFEKGRELQEKQARLAELDELINLDNQEQQSLEAPVPEKETEKKKPPTRRL